MKKKIIPVVSVIGIVLLVIAIIGISTLVKKYTPSKERMDLSKYFDISSDSDVAIVLNKEKADNKATMINGEIYPCRCK